MVARLLGILVLFTFLSSPVLGDHLRGIAAYLDGDYATALREFRAAAGNAAAQIGLATMYANGQGVPQDYAESARWLRLAAEQGEAFAQYNLGAMYLAGRGVPQNGAEAIRLYRLAAQQGFSSAQFALGALYQSGQGVPQDYAEAVRWYWLAAEQGLAIAQVKLGAAYSNGIGVPRDDIRAYGWTSMAAAQGYEGARENLDSLETWMTREQIAEAQRWVRERTTSDYTTRPADPQPTPRDRGPSQSLTAHQKFLWVLVILGVVAPFSMYFYSRRRGAKETPPKASTNSSLQGLAVRELARGNVESGIWETAQQIGKNDKAKTEGAYVALRVAQLEQMKDKRAEHPSKPEAAEINSTPPRGDRGLLLRLVNGEVGLAKTFWLFLFLPTWLLFFLVYIITLIPSAPVIATTVALFTAYKIVAIRAVWLASARYNGPRVWWFLARLTVVLGVAGVIYDGALIFELLGAPLY